MLSHGIIDIQWPLLFVLNTAAVADQNAAEMCFKLIQLLLFLWLFFFNLFFSKIFYLDDEMEGCVGGAKRKEIEIGRGLISSPAA